MAAPPDADVTTTGASITGRALYISDATPCQLIGPSRDAFDYEDVGLTFPARDQEGAQIVHDLHSGEGV